MKANPPKATDLMAKAALPLALYLLSACASLSEQECKTGNWDLIGYTDATEGYTQARAKEHSEACADLGISVDFKAYLQGFDRGLPNYCTASNAFRAAESGNAFPNQCNAMRFPGLPSAYQKGQQAYSLNQDRSLASRQIDEKQKQIDVIQKNLSQLERRLNEANTPSAEKRTLRNEIESLKSLLRDLYAEQASLRQKVQTLQNQRDALAGTL